MSVRKGLKEIEQQIKERQGGARATWLKLNDKETVKLRFISELDADSPAYSEERGLAIVVSEHTHPKEFKRKAVCTREEGQCVGCESALAYPKTGWASKMKMYANVWVIPKKEDPYLAIFSVSINAKSTVWAMLKSVYDDQGAISDKTWTYGRTGKNFNDTVYTLVPGASDKEPFDYGDTEFYDLEKVAIREIPYEEQHDFYFKEFGTNETQEAGEDAPAGDLTTEW